MRFISHIRKYGVGILQRNVEILPGGVEREIQPMLTASFEQGDLRTEEVEAAERLWKRLPGSTTEVDEVTMIPHFKRLSSYDTEKPANLQKYHEIDQQMEGKWLPGGRETWEMGSTKKLVEAKLLAKAGPKIDFFYAEAAPISPPWPLYDAFPGTAEDLVEVLLVQGHNIAQAYAYEQQTENRPDVLELLKEKLEAQAAALNAPVEAVIAG